MEMKKKILTFGEFILESNAPTSVKGDDKATVKALGDTGISVVLFKEGQGFSAPDSKPYILLMNQSVEFLAFLNNKQMEVVLTSDSQENKEKGAKKRVWDSKEWTESNLLNGTSPDLEQTVRIVENAVYALYNKVDADTVTKTIKAIRAIKKDYATEVEKNSLFANLHKKIVEIVNLKDPQELLTKMGGTGKKTTYTKEVFDGVKGAWKKEA